VSSARSANSPLLFRHEEGTLANHYATKPTTRLTISVVQRPLPHRRLKARTRVRIGPSETEFDQHRCVVGDRRKFAQQKSLDVLSETYTQLRFPVRVRTAYRRRLTDLQTDAATDSAYTTIRRILRTSGFPIDADIIFSTRYDRTKE
jgi:hypothetical protein